MAVLAGVPVTLGPEDNAHRASGDSLACITHFMHMQFGERGWVGSKAEEKSFPETFLIIH